VCVRVSVCVRACVRGVRLSSSRLTVLKQFVVIDAREEAPASVATIPFNEVDSLYGTLANIFIFICHKVSIRKIIINNTIDLI